jgi:hypothetical protein
MAKPNITGQGQIDVHVREIDFVTRFGNNWRALLDILSIMRPIRKQPGTRLVSYKAGITLQDGNVGEGEEIPYSQATVEEVYFDDLTLEKYSKAVSIEAVNKYGARNAITRTDDAFLTKLQNKVCNEFYDFLQTGTLVNTSPTFQMAMSMAKGRVIDKFEKMDKDVTAVAEFVNTLDVAKYLGGAQISTQTVMGMQYIRDFLGAEIVFVSSKIPQGVVIATPVENIDLYYTDPGDGEYQMLGLEYTVEGVTNLIGFHASGNYHTAVGESFALMGMKLWAEFLDGIAIEYINDATIADITVAPKAQADTIYNYTVSDLQGADVAINGNVISGTVKYVTTGDLASYWGPGNFLALDFGEWQNVKVGLVPSQGSGMAALDSDKDAAFKITSNDQKIMVQKTVGNEVHTQIYDLALTLETE